MKKFAFFVLLPVGMFSSAIYASDFVRDCSGDPSLVNNGNVIHCESWEKDDWYLNGYQRSDRAYLCKPGTDGCSTTTALSDPFDPNSPLVPSAVGNTQIVDRSDSGIPCISGNCLKVHMLEGSHGSLTAKWQLAEAGLQPDELYLSYYIMLSDNWVPVQPGGKFPGLVDVRIPNKDPSGQCGNGGASSDGLNCWSLRANFNSCTAGGKDVCSSEVPNATTRFGYYSYIFDHKWYSGGYGLSDYWDQPSWSKSSTPAYVGNNGCDSHPFNSRCAIGNLGMLENNRWYHVEMYVKMNTPLPVSPGTSQAEREIFYNGKGDGIITGWIDGQLAFYKQNAIFRLQGHDNLHVKTVWLDVFMGGSQTNPHNQAVYLDQMVVSSSRIGPRNFSPGAKTDTISPSSPQDLITN